MNVYKFGKEARIFQPKTIYWKPFEVKYPPEKVNPVHWKIFAQQSIVLQPGEKNVDKFRIRFFNE